ncbi:hypothetical protein GQ457_12G021210 [Hibiscus cannabinus]
MADLKLKVKLKISVVLVTVFCFLLFRNRVQSLSMEQQPYKTGYHFQPPKNWINGPVYYKGVYHMFYRYNPYAAVWGNISWAHSISYDLVNWIHLDNALSPDDSFDINGCWSGSTTVLSDGKPVIRGGSRNLNLGSNNSFNDCDHYVLGNYMPVTDNFSVDTDFLENGSDLRYDYGKFYASKTFFDSGKKRRILWGWIPESDSTTDDIEKGWSGLQWKRSRCSVPKMSASRTRNSRVDLYFKSQALQLLRPMSNLNEAELMDPSWVDPQLLCSQKTASVRGNVGPFGILAFASNDLTEQTAIFFRVFRSTDKYVVLMCSDQSRSSLREGLKTETYGAFIDIDPLHEKISLRSLIDHSIVESFGGEGRACITARVYPKLAIDNQAYLYAFNNGTFDVNISTLNAWSMKKAQIVSSTKRRKPHLN